MAWLIASLSYASSFTMPRQCRHEIRRQLFLGRKAMTNLDSVLKCKDITLPTKVHIVKAMIFPVVMYGCETIKKVVRQRINALELFLGWEDPLE